jgi:hypothetical protein
MVRTSNSSLLLEVSRLKPTQCVRISAGGKFSVLRTQYSVQCILLVTIKASILLLETYEPKSKTLKEISMLQQCSHKSSNSEKL